VDRVSSEYSKLLQTSDGQEQSQPPVENIEHDRGFKFLVSKCARLERENKLLRYIGSHPSTASVVLDLQQERDRYKEECQRLLLEVDMHKTQREKDEEAFSLVCTSIASKVHDIMNRTKVTLHCTVRCLITLSLL
jgi:hypothetical protein